MAVKCDEPKTIAGHVGTYPSPAQAQKAAEGALKKRTKNFECPGSCRHFRVLSTSITVIGHAHTVAGQTKPARFGWDASWEAVVICRTRLQIEEV